MGRIFLADTDYFLPEKVLSNEDLFQKFGTPPEENFKKTGVKKRHHTTPEIVMSKMAVKAAEKLFLRTPNLRSEIDAVLLVGHGFDYKAPISSAIIQHELSIQKNCIALDLPHGCTGFINGLAVAKGLLEGGMARKVLLLTGDTPSFVIDPENEELLSLFCDSGTASIIEMSGGQNEKFVFGTNGSGAENLMVKRSGTASPATIDWLKESGMIHGTMEMNSTEIFSFALKTVPSMINDVLLKNNMELDAVDLFIFHQANSFLLEVLRKKIKIPAEKFVNDMEHTGNTVSSSIPIALRNAETSGRLKRGMTVLLAGFGIGYTWGSTIITY